MAWSLEGKVAIVTGCASGIGLTATRLYLEAGAVVFGIDISPFPDPSPIPGAISTKFHFHRANLMAPGACDESVAACLSKTGRKVDILANVAGVMDSFEAVHKLKDDAWDRVIGVNTTVPMKLMRAVLNEGGMLEQNSGRIINVSSKAGISGGAAGFAYTASKHALVSLVLSSAALTCDCSLVEQIIVEDWLTERQYSDRNDQTGGLAISPHWYPHQRSLSRRYGSHEITEAIPLTLSHRSCNQHLSLYQQREFRPGVIGYHKVRMRLPV